MYLQHEKVCEEQLMVDNNSDVGLHQKKKKKSNKMSLEKVDIGRPVLEMSTSYSKFVVTAQGIK